MRWLIVVVVTVVATAAHADDPKSFDASAAVALLGKPVVVHLADGGTTSGVLAEAGPSKIVIVVAGAPITIEAARIETIGVAVDDARATPPPSPPPPPTTTPPPSAGPSVAYTDSLLNHFVVVRAGGRFYRGQLVVSSEDGVVVKADDDNHPILRREITAITIEDAPARAHTQDDASRDREWQREKKAANVEQAANEVKQHADSAILWYGVGGVLLAASVVGCATWTFLYAAPFVLIGACGLALAGGGAIIYGLVESATASAAQTKAQAMAY